MSISDEDYERIDAQDAMADLDEMTEWCICPDCGGQKDLIETWGIGDTAVCDNCLPARIAALESEAAEWRRRAGSLAKAIAGLALAEASCRRNSQDENLGALLRAREVMRDAYNEWRAAQAGGEGTT